MIELNIEKAKILLTSALETFLTFNDDIECYNYSYLDNDEDNFVIASLYEYIDAIKIIKAYENTDEKLFLINCSILDDDIVITIKYSDEVPYMITLENFDDKWVYNEHLSVIKESKVVINNRIKNFYKSRLEEKFELKEKLSFSQLKSEVVPQSKANQNLNYFYKQRNKLNGQGNRNIKFVTSQFDPNDGSITFMYRTDATYNDEDKKELVNDNPNDGELRQNISDEYDLQLKICDFWKILEELISPTDDNFTKEDMKAVLELSEEVRINCDCPSQYWTGSDFYLTQLDAQLKDCTIAPKWWNQPHLRPNVLVCKHLLSLLNHISFFLPNMAMSCKKELKNYGLI